VCNDDATNTMRTDCGDPDTATEVVKNFCEDKHECEVKVEEDIFAHVDCDDTTKYLEVQWQCKHIDHSQPRFPKLEGNITTLWNSYHRSLSMDDLEQALESAGKVDTENKEEEALDTIIEMQSIPSAFIHKNVEEDDILEHNPESSAIEVVPRESEKYPTVNKDDMISMIVPMIIITAVTSLVIILASIAAVTKKIRKKSLTSRMKPDDSSTSSTHRDSLANQSPSIHNNTMDTPYHSGHDDKCDCKKIITGVSHPDDNINTVAGELSYPVVLCDTIERYQERLPDRYPMRLSITDSRKSDRLCNSNNWFSPHLLISGSKYLQTEGNNRLCHNSLPVLLYHCRHNCIIPNINNSIIPNNNNSIIPSINNSSIPNINDSIIPNINNSIIPNSSATISIKYNTSCQCNYKPPDIVTSFIMDV